MEIEILTGHTKDLVSSFPGENGDTNAKSGESNQPHGTSVEARSDDPFQAADLGESTQTEPGNRTDVVTMPNEPLQELYCEESGSGTKIVVSPENPVQDVVTLTTIKKEVTSESQPGGRSPNGPCNESLSSSTSMKDPLDLSDTLDDKTIRSLLPKTPLPVQSLPKNSIKKSSRNIGNLLSQSESRMKMSSRKENKSPELRCRVCGAVFPDISQLSTHMWLLHENKSFECHRCDQNFGKFQQLQQHLSLDHSDDSASDDPAETSFLVPLKSVSAGFETCKICFKQFSTEARLNTHLWSVHQFKGFSCKTCLKSFPHQRNLDQHFRLVHRGLKRTRTQKPDANSLEYEALNSTQSVLDQIEKLQQQMKSSLAKNQSREEQRQIKEELFPPTPAPFSRKNLYNSRAATKQIPNISSMKSNNSSVFSSKPSFVPPKVLIRKENKDSEQKNIPDSAKNNSSSLGVDLTLIDPSELFAKMLGPLDLEGKKDGVERKVYLCDRINKVSMAATDSSCRYCGEKYYVLGTLFKHLWEKHEKKNFICEICHKSYGFRKIMCEHVSYVHCLTKRYGCKLCGKNFSKRYMLLTHAEKEHKIFDKSLLKKETYDVDMS